MRHITLTTIAVLIGLVAANMRFESERDEGGPTKLTGTGRNKGVTITIEEAHHDAEGRPTALRLTATGPNDMSACISLRATQETLATAHDTFQRIVRAVRPAAPKGEEDADG